MKSYQYTMDVGGKVVLWASSNYNRGGGEGRGQLQQGGRGGH